MTNDFTPWNARPGSPLFKNAANRETDWLGSIQARQVDASALAKQASTEADAWIGTKNAAVLADPEELTVQALGYADLWAGQFGAQAAMAKSAFMARLVRLGVGVEDYEEYFEEDRAARVRYEKTEGDTNSDTTKAASRTAATGNPFNAHYSDDPAPWKAQFAGVAEGVWSGNGLTFETPEEATAYAQDLLMRWTGADMARVVPTDTPNKEPVDVNDDQIVISYRTASLANLQTIPEEEVDPEHMPAQAADLVPTTEAFNAGEFTVEGNTNKMTPQDWDRFYEGDGVSSGVPKDIFPQGGVPLHGDLTPEQEAWLKSRSSRRTAASPAWLQERVNDPYGTPNKVMGDDGEYVDNPFWVENPYEDINDFRVIERDGKGYVMHRRQNYWMNFNSRDEAVAHARGADGSLDMWASRRTASAGDVADCPYCDADLTQEADGVFRHLSDDGCSFGNEGFSVSEMEAAHPGISFSSAKNKAPKMKGDWTPPGSQWDEAEGEDGKDYDKGEQMRDEKGRFSSKDWSASQSDPESRHDFVGSSERCRVCNFTANHVIHGKAARKTGAATLKYDDTGSHWAGLLGGDDYVPLPWTLVSNDGTVLGAWPTQEAAQAVLDSGQMRFVDYDAATRTFASKTSVVNPTLEMRPIYEIAADIKKEWGSQVNFGAVPYLDAMMQIASASDMFYSDSGTTIVSYFLSNASTFRGDRAKELKNELKRHIGRTSSKTASGPFDTPTTCTSCGASMMEIDAFPGNVCLDCYAASEEGQRMPTGQEVVEMWGGTWKGGSRRTAGAPGMVDENNQDGAAISTLPDVDVASAPENLPQGWLDDDAAYGYSDEDDDYDDDNPNLPYEGNDDPNDDWTRTSSLVNTCQGCGNTIVPAQRAIDGSESWAEVYEGYGAWGDDRDFQCVMTGTGQHVPSGVMIEASRRTAVSIPPRATTLINQLESAPPGKNVDDPTLELSNLLESIGMTWAYGSGDKIRVMTPEQFAEIRALPWSERRWAVDDVPDARTSSRRTALPGDDGMKPDGARPQTPLEGHDDSAMFEPDEILGDWDEENTATNANTTTAARKSQAGPEFDLFG